MTAVSITLMRRTVVLSALLVSIAFSGSASSLISSVQVISSGGSELQAELQTRPGAEFDASTIRADVQKLYATRRVHDVQVSVTDKEAGKHVVFNVVPLRPRLLREVHFSPSDFKHKPHLPTGIPIDEVSAQKLSADYRKQLLELAYLDPKVEAEVVSLENNEADLVFHVSAGEPVKVGRVNLIGETGLDPKQIEAAMQNLRSKHILPGIPKLWGGWKLKPNFSEAAVDADVARVSSLYLSRGYFDAMVRRDGIDFFGGQAEVSLALQPGERYQVRSWSVQGPGMRTRSEFVKGAFDADELCECLFDLRQGAQEQGHWDWNVRAGLRPVDGSGTVDLIATIDPGPAYTVRRISFTGNRSFSDGHLRANFLLDEADPLDPLKLRKSIARLNRSRFFEPLDERSVEIRTNPEDNFADIRVNLRERKIGSWLLSGPVGPMSLSGPLQFMLASRLPAWGRGILEASTYVASFSLLAQADPISKMLTGSSRRILPILSIERPFTPGEGWKSGFVFAPQLGWRSMALSYGMTQLRQRAVPWLQGDKSLMTVLPVTIEREGGEAVLLCAPPDPKLKWLRTGAAVALQFAGSFAVL